MRRGKDRNADLEAEGILQKSDGTYVKAEIGTDSQVRYVPVPASELPQDRSGEDTGVAISTALTRELDIHYQSIARKVALNPTIFTYYSYMTGKGDFEGDMGDFLNFCVKFTMKYGYGVEITMSTGGRSLLTVLQQNQLQATIELDSSAFRDF